MMFLAWFVASCGYSRGDPSAEIPSPTVMPHKKASPLAPSPTTTVQPAAPDILPGDWPSFLLGSGGFNSHETAITSTTASTLTRSWVAHAGGGISSEPMVVDWTIYWSSWDGSPDPLPGLVVASVGPSFFVLDATQGTTVFAYQDTAKDSTFDGAATIAHGMLYIGNLDGTLFAFTLASE